MINLMVHLAIYSTEQCVQLHFLASFAQMPNLQTKYTVCLCEEMYYVNERQNEIPHKDSWYHVRMIKGHAELLLDILPVPRTGVPMLLRDVLQSQNCSDASLLT